MSLELSNARPSGCTAMQGAALYNLTLTLRVPELLLYSMSRQPGENILPEIPTNLM
jgi:hypothetical protein